MTQHATRITAIGSRTYPSLLRILVEAALVRGGEPRTRGERERERASERERGGGRERETERERQREGDREIER